jgi:nucleoside-diphosphate-sugar epimerase
MPGIEFVALRYGFFYGPGTWYTREGDMGDQVRRQQWRELKFRPRPLEWL